MRKPTIFLTSSAEGIPIAHALATALAPWADTSFWSAGLFNPNKTLTESLTEAAARSDFAVFVLTTEQPTRRQDNATLLQSTWLFELGFLAGSLGLARTFLVAEGSSLRLPTDLAGIQYMPVGRADSSNLLRSVAPVAEGIARVAGNLGLRTDKREDFYSCFISYSSADKDFAVKLHDDLQQVGVRTWLDAKEMSAGERILDQIDHSIQAHDKILVVLSRASIGSSWVEQEVRRASELERHRKEPVLFPIKLDDANLHAEATEALQKLRTRYILDFSEWQDTAQYRRSFSKLVRDLAISASVASSERR